eukprot:CAMPEP_0115844840 /NCGR_PEP_ID=MMETSP0287-20121206/9034_1 /TAXON_ID=412157 /ORGANISM="Chrysochromulina rotalis, Strain UIO044" /LENGTH=182 /DNA_ID=CAMNT_0003298575 /DNA_START=527 /DNA_END=1073 /DNA_ORIENTATION=-
MPGNLSIKLKPVGKAVGDLPATAATHDRECVCWDCLAARSQLDSAIDDRKERLQRAVPPPLQDASNDALQACGCVYTPLMAIASLGSQNSRVKKLGSTFIGGCAGAVLRRGGALRRLARLIADWVDEVEARGDVRQPFRRGVLQACVVDHAPRPAHVEAHGAEHAVGLHARATERERLQSRA